MTTAPISTSSDLMSALNAAGPATKLADSTKGDEFARVLSGVKGAAPTKALGSAQSLVKNDATRPATDSKPVDAKSDAKTDDSTAAKAAGTDANDTKTDSKSTDTKTDSQTDETTTDDDKTIAVDGKEIVAAVAATVAQPIIAPVVDATAAAQAVATTVAAAPTTVANAVQTPATTSISALTAPAAISAPVDFTAAAAPAVADPLATGIADPTAVTTTLPADPAAAALPQAPTFTTTDTTPTAFPGLTDILNQTQGDAPVVTTLTDVATPATPADVATPSALPSDAALAKAALDSFAVTQVNNDNTQSALAATRTTGAAMQSEPYRQVVNIVAPLKSLADGDYSMTLKLHPEHLGSVEITVALAGGQINMSMNSDNPAARQQLRDSMNDLRSSLADSGLTAGSLDVGSNNAGDQQRTYSGSTSSTRVDVNDEDTSLLRFAVQVPQNVSTTGDSALDIQL